MMASINIKGIRDGLLVSVGEGDWGVLKAELLEQMKARSSFIQGARVTIDVGAHTLPAAEMGRLRDELSDLGISLWAVISTSTVTESSAQSLGLGTRIFKPAQQTKSRTSSAQTPGEEGMFVQRTVRSGVKIEYPGHITIIGDVNPGAEVVAGGSILVWGRLKGVVHAGAEGDESAVIAALQLTPTQLRIAGQIAIPPDQRGKPQPEIARIRDGRVVAEHWNVR
jgi:septum site-determining protein MinC